jgi:hypothetical protein
MNKKMTLAIVAFVAVVTATSTYALTSVVRGQASVFQGGGGGGSNSNLGQSIQDLTQGIIAGTNEQVQNTLESAQNQALPQLQSNASAYDCLIVVMNFGKAHGAMTCSPDQSLATGVTVNSQNAPGLQAQAQSSSIQSSSDGGNSATSMQNRMTGSGSSSNIISGVP